MEKLREMGIKFWAGMLVLCGVLSVPLLLGCDAIMAGFNAESTYINYQYLVDVTVPVSGEKWFGGIAKGDYFTIYTYAESITTGGKLQVFNASTYTGIPNTGWVNVADYPAATANLIHDRYFNFFPSLTPGQFSNITMTAVDYTTKFPKFLLYMTLPTSLIPGTIIKLSIAGLVLSGGTYYPTLRIVDSSGNQQAAIDSTGRRAYLRVTTTGNAPTITSTNMALTFTGTVPSTSQPSITTDSELGYVVAAAVSEPTYGSGCFSGTAVSLKTQYNYDQSTSSYTYKFDPFPSGSFVSGRRYAFFLATQTPFSGLVSGGDINGPPERLTQGLNVAKIPYDCTDSTITNCPSGGSRQAVDTGSLNCGSPTTTNTLGYVYYFQAP